MMPSPLGNEHTSSPTSTISTSASSPRARQSMPELDTLVFIYDCPAGPFGYSLYLLDLDFTQPSDATSILPDPLLLFGIDGELPDAMGFFMHGYRLYMIAGLSPGGGFSTATYYIDLDDIYVLQADHRLLVKKGPDMAVGCIAPLIFSVGGMFYVISHILEDSSCFEMFDPEKETWTLLPELSLRRIPGMEYTYSIRSHMVDAGCIYLSTESGIFVFDTNSAKWITPKDVMGVRTFRFSSGCVESSQFYVACGVGPASIVMFPKCEANSLAKPIFSGADLIWPYEEHLEYRLHQMLLQVSQDRFCYICEGCDSIPYGYFNEKDTKKHIIVHVFDLAQHVGGSLHSGNYNYQCQDLSRVLYTMDNSRSETGEICYAFLIRSKDLKKHYRVSAFLKSFKKLFKETMMGRNVNLNKMLITCVLSDKLFSEWMLYKRQRCINPLQLVNVPLHSGSTNKSLIESISYQELTRPLPECIHQKRQLVFIRDLYALPRHLEVFKCQRTRSTFWLTSIKYQGQQIPRKSYFYQLFIHSIDGRIGRKKIAKVMLPFHAMQTHTSVTMQIIQFLTRKISFGMSSLKSCL